MHTHKYTQIHAPIYKVINKNVITNLGVLYDII